MEKINDEFKKKPSEKRIEKKENEDTHQLVTWSSD